jgi:hypothetical protein
VSSDKIDVDELKNYEDINENLAMIRSFQVALTLRTLGNIHFKKGDQQVIFEFLFSVLFLLTK